MSRKIHDLLQKTYLFENVPVFMLKCRQGRTLHILFLIKNKNKELNK